MSKINLLPKEEFDRKSYGKFLKWVLTYGRYIIISVELVVFLVFFSRFIFDQQLAELQEEIEQKQSIVASAKKFEQEISSIQNRLAQVKTFEAERSSYMTILQKLKSITPVDIVFTRIVFDGNDIILSGEALTNESFAKFITSLTNEPTCREITITTLEKDIDAGSLVFTTTAKIAGPSGTPFMHEPSTVKTTET